MAQDTPGILDAVKSVANFGKSVFQAPGKVGEAVTNAPVPPATEAQIAARDARAAGQSALQDAIDRGLSVNQVPSQLTPIPGTKLGQ